MLDVAFVVVSGDVSVAKTVLSSSFMADLPISAVAQLNAQTAAANLMDQPNHLTKFWSQITQKFPEMRNATHYYAHDVAKASRLAVEAAVSTVMSTALHVAPQSGPDAQPAPSQKKTANSHVEEGEVHYAPVPSSSSVGLVVRSVEIQSIPGPDGGLFLLILLAKVGHIMFEVTEHGVFEVYTDLSNHSDDVIAMKILDRKLGVIVLRAPNIVQKVSLLGGVLEEQSAFPSVSAAEGLHLVGKTHAVVTNRDFHQIHVVDISLLREVRVLHADASLVAATSQTLLAFCALAEEVPAVTKFSANAAESTLQTVAKNVSSFSKLLWGTTPQIAPQVQPLGTVALYDALSNEIVGSFSPHNHVIAAMAFSGDGTLLATASHSGTSVNIFQIFREVPEDGHSLMLTNVSLIARLSRGLTRADVTSLSFSPLSRFVSVATAIGTCHLFDLQSVLAHRGLSSVGDDQHKAPLLSAFARARSAPVGIVNPRTSFSSKCGEDVSTCMLVIASSFGVVTAVKCAPRGVAVHFSHYFDGFKGPKESSQAQSAAVDVGSRDLLALRCNAQVELETHERYSPLECFCFDGKLSDSEVVIPQHEWDECSEIRDPVFDRRIKEQNPHRDDSFDDTDD